MTLPVFPNPISFSAINIELGRPATQLLSMDDADVRTLAGKPTGVVSIGDLHGKSFITISMPTTATMNQLAFSGGTVSSYYNWNDSSSAKIWLEDGSDEFLDIISTNNASDLAFFEVRVLNFNTSGVTSNWSLHGISNNTWTTAQNNWYIRHYQSFNGSGVLTFDVELRRKDLSQPTIKQDVTSTISIEN